MLTEFDIENVERLLMGDGDWFTARLMRLIAHADMENKERIRLGYPKEVALWESWFYKDAEHPVPVPD